VLRGTGCPAAARGVVMLRYHHGSRRSPGASVAALKTACPLATTPANDPLPQSGSAQLERSVTGFVVGTLAVAAEPSEGRENPTPQ